MRVIWILCIFCMRSREVTPQPCTTYEQPVARLAGDIMIGGLFPVHMGVTNLMKRMYNESLICERLQIENLIQALAMVYGIEKINNSTLLPGIKLGYEIFDTCSDFLKAVRATMRLIPRPYDNSGKSCPTQPTVFPIKAVLGGTYSEVSIPVARLLSNYLIPQVSPGSTASALSERIKFPSFFRTVGENRNQAQVVVDMIKFFGWNWVGIIASDDEYGKSFVSSLRDQFEKDICEAFFKSLPSYVFDSAVETTVYEIIQEINQSSANVVILAISKRNTIKQFLKECADHNITRTWIATDTWASSKDVFGMEDIESVGTILGINFNYKIVEGFEDYLRNVLTLEDGSVNSFLEEYQELRFNCTEKYMEYLQCRNASLDNCTLDDALKMKSPLACEEELHLEDDDYLVERIEWRLIYRTYLAVQVIAQALDKLLCKDGTCQKKDFLPSQLLEIIKKPDFSFNGTTFHFTASGDLLTGYDILHWKFFNGTKEMTIIGSYDAANRNLTIDMDRIIWQTDMNKIPFSNCSRTCLPGFYRKYSNITCCSDCIECSENFYADQPDMTECKICPSSQWSKSGSATCQNRKKDYFTWSDKFTVTLVTFAVVGVLVVLISGCLFVKYIHSPAVKAAGGAYAFLFMIALLSSLASIGLFVGKPNNTICMIRQPLYGISSIIAISCILNKSIAILLAPESSSQDQRVAKQPYHPIVVIAISSGIQILICAMWLAMKPPFYVEDYSTRQLVVLFCNKGSYAAYAVMLSYNGLVSLFCFILAFRARKLADRYNDTQFITFSMLFNLFVWILFIPIYINTTSHVYRSVIQAVAILASLYGLIACHLLSVCYVLLFKKDNCTKYGCLERICLPCKSKAREGSMSLQSKEDLPALPKIEKEDMSMPKKCLLCAYKIRKRHFSC